MGFQALSGQFSLMQNINEIEELIKLISKLPGLGPKSAKRIVLKLMNSRDELMKPMANTLNEVYKNVSRCKACGTLKSNSVGCNNCENKDKKIILKKEFFDNAKKSEIYQKVLKIFPDAELIDIDIIKEKNDD